jgi:hypothetical protein
LCASDRQPPGRGVERARGPPPWSSWRSSSWPLSVSGVAGASWACGAL